MAAVCVVCGVAWADSFQKLIAISVVDGDGRAIPVATVELQSGDQVIADAVTGGDGRTILRLARDGEYHLAVSKKDYLSFEVTFRVAANSSVQEMQIVLSRISLSQQSVDVKGAPASPVAEASASESQLATEPASRIPSKPATVKDALPLFPGVVRALDGSIAISGLGEHHSTMLVNSVNVTDPATGEFGLSVPIDSVENISVAETPYLAQYGKFTAGVVTVDTRRGSEKWSFSVNDPLPEFRIRSLQLRGLKNATPRLNLSGPIIKNKLYVLEGGEYLINKQAVRTLPFPHNETVSSAINSFTQVDYILSATHTLMGSFHFAPHSMRHAGLNFFDPKPVTPDARFHASTGALIDRMTLDGGVLQSTFAITHVSSGITPRGALEMVVTPVGNKGNYFSQQSRRASRVEWLESWTAPTLHFHGDHTVQMGAAASHSENDGELHAQPVLVEDAAGRLLKRIEFKDGRPFTVSDTAPAIFLQDHWVISQHFAVDAGVRLEAQTVTATWRSAPRAGFVWSPAVDNKTVVRGGIGVFYDHVPLDVYAFRSYPQQIVTTYDGYAGGILDGPRRFINTLGEVARKSFRFVHRSLSSGNFAPYSIAGTLEIQRSMSDSVLVRFKYLESAAQELLTIEPHTFGNRGSLVLAPNGSARTRQFEFTSRMGRKEGRQFFFSYVHQQASGDFNQANQYLGNFPFPVARSSVTGSLPNEIPNRFMAWGTYDLPRQVAVIPLLEVRNGFPYQRVDVMQNYVVGPAGRFPHYLSLDVRLTKDLAVGHGHAIRIGFSVLNATNHFNPLQIHANIADPVYGSFFGYYPRRFALDLDFLR